MESIQNKIMNEAIKSLNGKLDDLFIEALRVKGFEFSNQSDLEAFIKERCRKEDYTHKQQSIYFIDDVPFLEHNYEIVYNPINQNEVSTSITINYGTYRFL